MSNKYEQLRRIGADVKVLETLSSLTNNIMILTDEVGKILWVNDAFTLTTEFEFSEVVGKVPGHLLQGPKTDLSTVQIIKEAIQKGEIFKVEILNYSKSGKEYWLNLEGHPIRNKDDRITNFLAIETVITKEKEYQKNLEKTLQDFEWKNWELSSALEQIEKETEERKKAENKLISSEKLLKETQKIASIGAWEINLLESSVFWTEEVYLIYELDESFVPTIDNELDYFYDQEKEIIKEAIKKCISDKLNFELDLRIVTSNQNIKWIRCIGYPVFLNNFVTAVRGTFQDITKERNSQEELNLSRNQLKSILESTKSSIFAIDNKYKYSAFNENHRVGAKLLWGVDIYVGMDVREANLNNPDKIKTQIHLERALKGEQFTILEKFGEEGKYQKFFEVHFTPIKDKDNNIFGVSIFSTDITERIEFQDRIRKSEEQYKLITTNSPFGIFLIDENGECTYSNEKYQKINNLTSDEAKGYGWLNSVYIYDKDKVQSQWSEAIASEVFNFIIEYRIYQNEDDIGWVIVKAVEIIENGKVTGYLGFVEDITDIKIAQEELNRLNQLQAAIINNSAQALIATDIEGVIQLFNPAAENMLGYKEEELIYQVSPAIFHDFDEVVKRAKEYSDELGISITPGFEVFVAKTKLGLFNEAEWTYVKKNNERFPVNLSISELRDKNNNITGFVGIAKDISKEKETLQELESTYANIKSLIENTTDSIWSIDTDYRIVNINSAFIKDYFYSYQIKLSIGDNILNNISIVEAIKWKERYDKAFFGERFSIEEKIEVNNLYYYTEITFNPVINDLEEIIGCSVFSRDITGRKESEEKLEHARELAEAANKSKSAFLANMSHEIRTPMNAILGFAELIQGSELNVVQKEYANGIINSGKSLMTLINDILDLSKIEAGRMEIKKEAVNVIRMCNELKQVFSVKVLEKGLELILDFQEDLPISLLLDETRLRQVLFNIVGNAVKFTNSGYIKIFVGFEINNLNKEEINLKFTIMDTGIGIPDNQHKTIFEAFKQQDEQSTRKYGGTGLGLTITKRLVEMMNGKVELFSQQGEGSSFILTFDEVKISIKKDDLEVNTNLDINLFEFKDAVILVAEDIKSNQMILKGFLKKYPNIKLIFTENGLELLEKAKELTPDLVLMDIQMPEMDGFQATQILKEMDKFRDIPVIALTAFAMTDEAKKIDEIFDGYLTKPLSKKILLEELNKYFGDNNNVVAKTKPEIEAVQNKKLNESNKDLFNKLFLNEVQILSKTIEIDKIKELNSKILDFAKDNNESYLQELSQNLSDSLATFNVTLIIKLLNDLGNL